MTATEALDHLRAQGLILTCTGATLRVAPRRLVTPAVSELLQLHKSDLLTLLGGESVEAPAVERQAQAAGGESHVAPASPSQSPSPAPCAPEWQTPQVQYCPDGQHVPAPDTPADHPRQCQRCPYVWPAADTPRHPAVHDPRCEGKGLVVVPGWGWSCPTCNRRYVVPSVPAASAPAQGALPLGHGAPHGEMMPSQRRR